MPQPSEATVSSPLSSRQLTLLLIALCALILAVDLRTPLGYAVPLLYGLPILLTLWHPARLSPLWVAAGGTALIGIGLLKSPAGGVLAIGLGNRGLIIAMGWLLAALLVRFKRTHVRLLVSESSLRRTQHVVDGAPDAILFADEQKRIIYANEEACRSLGYTREELLQLTVPDISARHDPARYASRLDALQRGEAVCYESVHRRKDGSEFPIEMTLRYQNHGGRPVTCAIARDITERKRVESALRLQEFAMDHSSEGMFIVAADGRILGANETVCRRLEYTRDELLTMTIADIDPDYSRERWPSHWQELKQAGRLVIETTNRAKSGRTFPVEVSIAYLPWDGREICCSVITDISARKAAEAKLAETAAMIEMVIEGSPDPIFLKDLDGKYLLMNRAGVEFLGRSKAEILGKRDIDLFPRDVAAHLRQVDEAVLQSGQAGTFEEVIERADGTHTFVSRKAPFRDATGKIVGLLGLAHDITARKQAEETLNRRLELERILAAISSDFINVAAGRLDADINAALARIGRFLAVDRGYVFLLSDDGATMSNTHEWCAAGISSEKDKLQRLPVDLFPWWMERMHRAEPIAIPSVADLPPEAEAERLSFQAQGIQSLIAVPITRGNRPLGCIGFDSVKTAKVWPDDDVVLLRTLGEIFVNTQDRLQAEARVVEANQTLEAQVLERTRALRLTQFSMDRAADAVFWIAPDARILNVNDAACRLLGYAREELVGRTVPDIDPGFPAEAWPAHWEEVRRRGSFTFDSTHLKKDGTLLQTEVTVNHLVYEGQEYNCAFMRDITARKEAESALKASEERFRQVTESIQDVFWLSSPDKASIHYVSPAYEAIWGQSCQSLYERPRSWLEAIHPDDRERVAQAAQTRQVEGRYRETYRIVRPDGATRWIEDVGFPVFDHDGRVVRVTGVASDITIRKEAESVLKDLNRALEQRVEERTAKLAELNAALLADIEIRQRAEADLAASEARFRAVYHSAAVGMTLCSTDGVLRAANPRFCEILGRPESEIIGHPFAELTHPDDLPENLEYVRRLVSREAQEVTFEKRYLRKDGSVVWAALSVTHLEEGEGEGEGEGAKPYLLTIVQDITARKQAEAELRESHRKLEESESFFRSVVDNLPHMVFIKDAQDLRFVRFNNAAEELIGLTESEILGKNDYDFFPKEQADFFVAKDRGVIESGQVLEIGTEPIQTTHRGLRYLRTKKFPLCDRDGRPQFLVGISEDVTDRMTMETALRESEERLRMAQLSANVGVWDWDLGENRLSWTPELETLYGLAPGSVRTYEDFRQRVYTGDLARIERERDEAIRDHRSFDLEFRVVRPSGEVLWVMARGGAFYDEQGRAIRVLGANVDITARKQAEAALAASEARFRQVFEQAAVGMMLVDRDRRILKVNRAMCELAGYDESELLGQTYVLCTHPEDMEPNLTLTNELIAGVRNYYKVDKRYIRKDGRQIWVSVNAAGVTFPGDPSPKILALIQDITEMKLAADALPESEERFRAAFDLSPIGMALCAPDGRFVSLNLQFCQLLGYAESELRGRHFSEVTHPDDVQRSQEGRAALLSGQISVFLDEERYLRKDGAVLTALLTLSTVRDRSGSPLFNLAQIQDLTTLRRTEADLRQAKELAAERARFQALVAALPDLAFIIDADGRYREVLAGNDAELYRPAQEVVGRTCHEVFPKELADRFLQFVRTTIESGLPQTIQYSLPMPEGVRWYEAKSSPPLPGGSGPPALLCVVRDVTERLRSQSLEERERIGRDLHDGVLQSLYATGLALESSQDLMTERPREGRQVLDKAVEQLNGVMQEVRQFIVGLDTEVLQGDDWEAAARALIQSHSAFYQIRSEIAIDPAAREALGVAERLALLNILREALSNALRHGRPQSIMVSLSRTEEGAIRLRIADDGRGFHPTAIGKAGFGLRNMKARADELGAVFQMTSELGKGTEVVVEVRSQEAPDHARIPR